MMKYLPFWILVQSDEENDVENLLNDSDTEFECITKDAEDFIMNAESSATQENVLEAVIHPETMTQNESDCDFAINNRNICSHTLSRQQKHNESSNYLKSIKEPKVCSGEKDILIQKSLRGKPKKSQVPPGERMRNNTFVEDLQWKSGGHETWKDVGHLLHIYTNLISIPEERINLNLG